MAISPEYERWLATNATAEELRRILGPWWAIARKTKANLARFERCITQTEYRDATALALRERGQNVIAFRRRAS